MDMAGSRGTANRPIPSVDITVVGSHGHGAIFEAIIGSTARKLLDTHTEDILIVGSDEGWAWLVQRIRPDKKWDHTLAPATRPTLR